MPHEGGYEESHPPPGGGGPIANAMSDRGEVIPSQVWDVEGFTAPRLAFRSGHCSPTLLGEGEEELPEILRSEDDWQTVWCAVGGAVPGIAITMQHFGRSDAFR